MKVLTFLLALLLPLAACTKIPTAMPNYATGFISLADSLEGHFFIDDSGQIYIFSPSVCDSAGVSVPWLVLDQNEVQLGRWDYGLSVDSSGNTDHIVFSNIDFQQTQFTIFKIH